MCSPGQLFFFQCGPETPTVGTPLQVILLIGRNILWGGGKFATMVTHCLRDVLFHPIDIFVKIDFEIIGHELR